MAPDATLTPEKLAELEQRLAGCSLLFVSSDNTQLVSKDELLALLAATRERDRLKMELDGKFTVICECGAKTSLRYARGWFVTEALTGWCPECRYAEWREKDAEDRDRLAAENAMLRAALETAEFLIARLKSTAFAESDRKACEAFLSSANAALATRATPEPEQETPR